MKFSKNKIGKIESCCKEGGVPHLHNYASCGDVDLAV